MPASTRARGNWPQLAAALRRASAEIRRGLFKPALRRAGVELRAWLVREYTGRARTEWPKIGWVTYALSSGRVVSPVGLTVGRGGKVTASRGKAGGALRGFAQLTARAQSARPLIDTGRMQTTLVRGPFAVFTVTDTSVEVGSRDPQLAQHQRPHGAALKFGPKEESNLKRNIPPKIGGKWNPLYFMARNAIKKMKGRRFTVKARPLPTQAPAPLIDRLKLDATKALTDLIRRTFR